MTFLGLRHEQKKNEPDPNKHRSTRQPGMTRSLSSLFDTRPPALRIGAYSHCGGATMVQTKLSVNQPGDHYQQEADRVADQVMRMPGASLRLQRKCDCGQHTIGGGGCSECEKKKGTLQRKASSSEPANDVPPIVHQVLGSPGQPLDLATRAFMEPRFGHDFSRVRVHTDSRAAESAEAVNALAYTVGRNIVFRSNDLSLNTRQGTELIAHELTHVVQQSHASVAGTPQSFSGDQHAPAELEADRVANRILGGGSAGPISGQPGSLHRKLQVDKAKNNIDNPTGKGVVQTNAVTVEGYLKTLCSGGSVTVDKNTGAVSLAAGFCPKPMAPGVIGPPAPSPADKSKEPVGCNCCCDMVASAQQWHIEVNDKDWPHTAGQTVTTVSPNSLKLWGAATESGKATVIEPWLVLGHELCGHAWLAEKKLPDVNATRGEGGHQETVARENELRKEHGIEARGSFKDPFCGESFWRDKAGPGPVQWSAYMKKCEAWRQKTYGGKYKIGDKIP